MIFPKRINNICKEVVFLFRQVAETILLEGSWAYGGANSASDLDFEVVVEDFQSLRNLKTKGKLPSITKGILNCLGIAENSKGINLLQAKHLVSGIPTGVRIIEFKTLRKISQINLAELNKDLFLLSVRDTERKGQSLVYAQRNFEGRVQKFSKKFWVVLGKQFTLVPVFLFDQSGYFYPGSLVDRYLCLPRILFDREKKGSKILRKLLFNVARRYFMEEEKFGFSKKPGIFQCLSRWEILSEKAKGELFLESEKLRKLLKSGR
jgi:hypothetical protein